MAATDEVGFGDWQTTFSQSGRLLCQQQSGLGCRLRAVLVAAFVILAIAQSETERTRRGAQGGEFGVDDPSVKQSSNTAKQALRDWSHIVDQMIRGGDHDQVLI